MHGSDDPRRDAGIGGSTGVRRGRGGRRPGARRHRIRTAAGLAGAAAVLLVVGACTPEATAGAGHGQGAPITVASPASASHPVDPSAQPSRSPAPITYLAQPPAPATPPPAGGPSSSGAGQQVSPAGDDGRGRGSGTIASGATGAGVSGAVTGTGVAGSANPGSTATATSSTAPSSQRPEPAASTITVDDRSPSTTHGAPVTVSYRLSSGGKPIPGARTEVSVGGHDQAVTVDGRGHGVVRLSTLPVGSTAVTLRYLGDAAHRPVSTAVTVTVARSHTEIRGLTVSGGAVTVDQNVTVPAGKDVTIGFDVVSGGKTVAGGIGTVVDGGDSTTVTIDGKGHASLTLTGLAPGAHQMLVRYAGDHDREGAGAPFTVTVVDGDAAPTSGAGGGSGTVTNSPCPATAKACVDLSDSTTWLQSGGRITYGPVPITSGRPGYRTPAGTFHVYWKDKDHHSSLFDDAPMPNSVFFVGGIAFHEGSLSVPSHGCIHLSWDASQEYWDSLNDGDTVVVFGYAPY